MVVSWNRGTPKSSIFIGFAIINHLFWVPPWLWKPPHLRRMNTHQSRVLCCPPGYPFGLAWQDWQIEKGSPLQWWHWPDPVWQVRPFWSVLKRYLALSWLLGCTSKFAKAVKSCPVCCHTETKRLRRRMACDGLSLCFFWNRPGTSNGLRRLYSSATEFDMFESWRLPMGICSQKPRDGAFEHAIVVNLTIWVNKESTENLSRRRYYVSRRRLAWLSFGCWPCRTCGHVSGSHYLGVHPT